MSINLVVMKDVLRGRSDSGRGAIYSFQVAADCNHDGVCNAVEPKRSSARSRGSCSGARQPPKLSHTMVNSAEQQGPTVIIDGLQIIW